MRDIRLSRVGHNNRNFLYKSIYVENNELKRENAPCDIFYSRDITPCTYSSDIRGNIKARVQSVTIETLDKIEAYPDDYVLYSGNLWHIDEVTEEDDDNQKQISKRPVVVRKIKLSRYV